jgi:hypothetical protein
MMPPQFALLPLDDRPPNLQFPRRLARVGDLGLTLPPKRLLGRYLKLGETEGLWLWLCDAASTADSLIVSCDMLAYGGLVASRTSDVSLDNAVRRIERLRELKARAPRLRVYAFAVIPRLGLTVSSSERARLGPALARYGELNHRVEPLDETDAAELAQLSATLPREVIAAHEEMRRRNLAVNKRLLALVAEGAVDFLVFAQEDAPPSGPHVAEQAELAGEAQRLGVSDLLRIYPGTDETGITLLARAAGEALGTKVPVYVLCGTPGGDACVALFEDRPLGLTIGGQIEGIGMEVAGTEDEADIVLAFHAPNVPKQTDITCVVAESAPSADFIAHIVDMLRAGTRVALADVAYCNGADPGLVAALASHRLLPHLAAFAGWNTSGNTIGTALAQAMMRQTARAVQPESRPRHARVTRAHVEFLFERLVDDYGYQTVVRREAYEYARETLGEFPLNLRRGHRRATEFVRERLEQLARQLFRDHFEGEVVDGRRIVDLQGLRIKLPWPRLFEVEVEARIELEEAG